MTNFEIIVGYGIKRIQHFFVDLETNISLGGVWLKNITQLFEPRDIFQPDSTSGDIGFKIHKSVSILIIQHDIW